MEIYNTIEEFNNYEVSTFGNIRNKTTNKILKGAINNCGYYTIGLVLNKKKCTQRIHRLVAIAFIENPENKKCVDHIDNNPLNNHISNLRWASYQENSYNRKINIKNTSGVKGVHFNKNANKWEAKITIDGIKIHLGIYLTLDEAKQARITKANAVFGVFTNKCEKK